MTAPTTESSLAESEQGAKISQPEPQGTGDKIRQGLRWSALSKYGAQLTQFVVSVILARLLAPELFGLMTMATLVVGFGGVFSALGLNNAIIRRKDTSPEFLSSVFFLQMSVAGIVAVGIALSAPLMAIFFQEKNVTNLVLALAAGFFVSSLAIVPTAILQKQLSFKTLAIRELSAALLGGTVAVIAAVNGLGVWSFVLGSITADLTSAIAVFHLVKWRPKLMFSSKELKGTYSFGLNLLGAGITTYFSRKGDDLIIGAALGKGRLGIYSLAYRLMLLPRDAVTAVVGRVLYPAMTRYQDDDAALSALYVRSLAAIGFVTFPMMTGLAVVATPFVHTVLGTQWQDAIPLIWILAPIGMIQSITSTQGQLFMTKGRTDVLFRFSLCMTVVRITLFMITVRLGLIPLAATYAITSLLALPFGFRLSNAMVEGLTLTRIARGLFPPLLISGFMAVAVLLLKSLLEWSGASSAVTLSVCVPTGMIFYAGVALLWRPPAADDFLELLPFKIPFVRPRRWSSADNGSTRLRPIRIPLAAKESSLRRLRTFTKKALLAIIISAMRLRSFFSRKRNSAVILAPSEPGSLGDEAMLVAISHELRQQGIQDISILEFNAAGHQHAIPYAKCIDLSAWYAHVKFATAVKAAWVISGSPRFYLIGADVMDGRYSPGRSLLRIEIAKIAARMGAQARIVGFSFSEHPNADCCDALKALPQNVTFCLRDAVSQERFQAIVGRESTLTADVAFLLVPSIESSTVKAHLEWISRQKSNNGEVLGVNINCNQHHLLSEMTPQELVTEFCSSLSGMLERRGGLSLVFISHDLRGDVSDFTLAAEIADRLAKTHPQRIRNVTVPISAAEIKAICGELDAVITGRMHLAIAALGAGTPVGGIAYLGKFEGLFQHFELRGLSIPPRRESIRKMADLGSSILDRREEIAAQIQQHWPDVRQLSLKNL